MRIYNGERIEDIFMWNAINIVVEETKGSQDLDLTYKIYKDLYKNTEGKGRAWNYEMIDRLYAKHTA